MLLLRRAVLGYICGVSGSDARGVAVGSCKVGRVSGAAGCGATAGCFFWALVAAALLAAARRMRVFAAAVRRFAAFRFFCSCSGEDCSDLAHWWTRHLALARTRMNGDLAVAERDCREAAQRIPAFGDELIHTCLVAKKKIQLASFLAFESLCRVRRGYAMKKASSVAGLRNCSRRSLT